MQILSEDFCKITFQEVSDGEIFRYGGNFYMKISRPEEVIMHDEEGCPINAINIQNGNPTYFQKGILITRFLGEVMVRLKQH